MAQIIIEQSEYDELRAIKDTFMQKLSEKAIIVSNFQIRTTCSEISTKSVAVVNGADLVRQFNNENERIKEKYSEIINTRDAALIALKERATRAENTIKYLWWTIIGILLTFIVLAHYLNK